MHTSLSDCIRWIIRFPYHLPVNSPRKYSPPLYGKTVHVDIKGLFVYGASCVALTRVLFILPPNYNYTSENDTFLYSEFNEYYNTHFVTLNLFLTVSLFYKYHERFFCYIHIYVRFFIILFSL